MATEPTVEQIELRVSLDFLLDLIVAVAQGEKVVEVTKTYDYTMNSMVSKETTTYRVIDKK